MATAGGELWVVFDGSVAVPDGVGTVQNEDVVAWNTSTGLWSLVFDGSAVGLASAAIGGLARLPNGHILLSFKAPFNVPGLACGPNGTSVDDSDIVRSRRRRSSRPPLGRSASISTAASSA